MKVRLEEYSNGFIAYNVGAKAYRVRGIGSTPADAVDDLHNAVSELEENYIDFGEEIPEGLNHDFEYV